MDLKKILVVYKRSTFEIYNSEGYNPEVKKMIEEGHVAVKMLKESHDVHQKSLEQIVKVLSDKKINFEVIFRGDLRPVDDFDLVITTGGDGTILETSKYVKNTPILGVNSDPKGSVGFFTGANKNDFANVVEKIIADKINKLKINRLQLAINDQKINELVLNDVLICHSIPAATSRYVISLNGTEEVHRSSGIWISTAAGSTAAIRSAGGIPLEIESDRFQYLVREFYDRGSSHFKLLGGIMEAKDKLEIVSQMRLGKIYIDGPFFDYQFTIGDKITFEKSDYPLNLLGFDNSKRENFLKKHNQT